MSVHTVIVKQTPSCAMVQLVDTWYPSVYLATYEFVSYSVRCYYQLYKLCAAFKLVSGDWRKRTNVAMILCLQLPDIWSQLLL